jgi:hypothetical protein
MPVAKIRGCSCGFCKRLEAVLQRAIEGVCGDVVHLSKTEHEHARTIIDRRQRSEGIHLQRLRWKPEPGSGRNAYVIIRKCPEKSPLQKPRNGLPSTGSVDRQACPRVCQCIAEEVRRHRMLLHAVKNRLRSTEYQSLLKFFETLLTRIWKALEHDLKETLAQ